MAEKDLENGDPKRERISFADGWDPDKDEGEYANLIRYISTYRDRRFSKAPSQVSGDDAADASQPKKLPFYRRILGGGKTTGDLYEIPEEWLNTDIKQGLTSQEVEERRRKTGFNELVTEKENMLLKFIGYFRGPILYGMWTRSSTRPLVLLTLVQLWSLLFFSLLVCVIGSTSVSSLVFCC
jgi:H+-transporting ATPase